LHVDPYPNTDSPGQTAECSAGNEPYSGAAAAIGNPAGNVGLKTETTTASGTTGARARTYADTTSGTTGARARTDADTTGGTTGAKAKTGADTTSGGKK
jgi:hypothetical protein